MCDTSEQKSKKKKYLQCFKTSYSDEFTCIKSSRKSERHAFCTDCGIDFSVAHAGRGDIVNHISSNKHHENIKKNGENSKISNFFAKNNSNSELKVIRAECLFTSFLVEHNLPLSCADHIGPLLRKIFPKDEIAKNYRCARTKTSAIIGSYSEECRAKLVTYLKKQPFCIATDGSNDSDSKIYPIIVTYFDFNKEQIENTLLSIPVLNGDSTGENIGNMVIENLKKYDVPLINCIGLVADNAPVMLGKKSGVAAVLRRHIANLIVVGCPCHLLHLSAEKAAACLPLNVDELLVDIYYFLDKSSKRKNNLKKFQELHNGDTKKILKHVCTRWLSLGKCINRLLLEWEPLISFFKEEVATKNKTSLQSYTIPKKNNSEKCGPPDLKKFKFDNKKKNTQGKRNSSKNQTKKASQPLVQSDLKSILSREETQGKRNITSKNKTKKASQPVVQSDLKSILSREERLFYILSDQISKCYCLFLSNIIPHFDKVNIVLQERSPLIHKLRPILLEFFQQMLSRFVKATVISEVEDCLKVDYHSVQNHKLAEDIVVGCETSQEVNELPREEKKKFYDNVIQFYVKACDYMFHKFPFSDELLIHAEICNVSTFASASFSSIHYFLQKFPFLLEILNCSIDELQAEFCNLQISKLPNEILMEPKIDVQWVKIKKFKNILGESAFSKIAELMLIILSIPHSNSECERLFSQVKKNRTEFRALLSNNSLEDLLIMKCNLENKCYEHEFTDKFLQKAKSASYVKNNC